MPSEIKNSLPFVRRLAGVVLILFSAAASAAPLTTTNRTTDLNGLVMAAATAAKPSSARAAPCGNCGQIESIREIAANQQTRGAPPVGGAMDNQIGAGRGQDLAMTGATVRGNRLEKDGGASSKNYEIVVRLDDGSTRTIHETHTPMWRPGDRVNVNNGTIQLAQ